LAPLTKLGFLILITATCGIPAAAQGCALCYTQAAASGNHFVEALQNGILALLLPPMFLSAGIAWLAYRKRNQFRNNTGLAGSRIDHE